jgi:hypothetical protein
MLLLVRYFKTKGKEHAPIVGKSEPIQQDQKIAPHVSA